MPASTGFAVATDIDTGERVSYGTASSARTLVLTRANCLVAFASVPTDTYGDITLTYELTNDRASNASIRPYYSDDGGTTWTEMTKGTGGDAKTTLTTSATGATHTFVWDTYTDMGNDWAGDVSIKVRAYDRDNYIGDRSDSQTFLVSLDNAPDAPTLVSPADTWFQKDTTPEFVCELPADNNPAASYSVLHVKLEVDTDSSFSTDDLEVFESRYEQNGWQYENASSTYIEIPAAGIPVTTALVGNYVRYIVDADRELPRTTLHWRFTFGGVL